ncbi:unnamed protein product [Miscanthus lutarioriparius]|uniref:DUF936 domain-containing protein n=1 Tax=Miscanthus lutarioriparius TaxID=422564 RepID=A0A811P3I3_9POAL|nr:unnamed protein product [Miscanthus lutarioriparius]
MTPLSSGVLVKLLDGMKTGVAKPVGEYQTAVLQVTNIVPAQLGEKDLLPTHDKFYIRVSDSSHIMYIMRPLARADHVLSNKLQLGQALRSRPASRVVLAKSKAWHSVHTETKVGKCHVKEQKVNILIPCEI